MLKTSKEKKLMLKISKEKLKFWRLTKKIKTKYGRVKFKGYFKLLNLQF